MGERRSGEHFRKVGEGGLASDAVLAEIKRHTSKLWKACAGTQARQACVAPGHGAVSHRRADKEIFKASSEVICR